MVGGALRRTEQQGLDTCRARVRPPSASWITSVSPLGRLQTKASWSRQQLRATRRIQRRHALQVTDVTACWHAGDSTDPCCPNSVNLDVTSCTNDRIVIAGFTGAYGGV